MSNADELSHASMKAEEILKQLRIRRPSEIDITDVAIERGAFVRERPLEGCEARLTRRGKHGIITIKTGIPEEGRKRFAIAHELGHFELHSNSQLFMCSEEDMLIWNESKAQETQANAFAANILMPEELFTKSITGQPPNMDEVIRLSEEFRTSLTATAIRYAGLSSEPCAVVVSKDCTIKWYRKSNHFKYHVKVGDKLSPNTYAFDFFDGIDIPKKPIKAPAYAWIAGNHIDGEAELMEHSLAFPRYNVVLTLLWIFDEIRSFHRRDEDEEVEHDLTDRFTPNGKRWRW